MLVDTNKVKDIKEIKVLGIDAMSRNFTFFKFKAILEKQPKRATGLILMDQNLIAGIGNIYRSEILFEAGVSPKRLVKNIEETEKKKIYQAIKKVLKKAIKLRGTSDSDYRDTSGVPGNFQKVLKVYRRDKQECKKCGIIIKRIKMGQRSVFLCSSCQR